MSVCVCMSVLSGLFDSTFISVQLLGRLSALYIMWSTVLMKLLVCPFLCFKHVKIIFMMCCIIGCDLHSNSPNPLHMMNATLRIGSMKGEAVFSMHCTGLWKPTEDYIKNDNANLKMKCNTTVALYFSICVC